MTPPNSSQHNDITRVYQTSVKRNLTGGETMSESLDTSASVIIISILVILYREPQTAATVLE